MDGHMFMVVDLLMATFRGDREGDEVPRIEHFQGANNLCYARRRQRRDDRSRKISVGLSSNPYLKA